MQKYILKKIIKNLQDSFEKRGESLPQTQIPLSLQPDVVNL